MGSTAPDPINRTQTPFLSVVGCSFPCISAKNYTQRATGHFFAVGASFPSLATFTGFAPFSVAVAKPGSYD